MSVPIPEDLKTWYEKLASYKPMEVAVTDIYVRDWLVLIERIAALEAQVAAYNTNGFADADAMASAYLDMRIRAEEAEAQNRQLRDVVNVAMMAFDAFWPSDPPENEIQAAEDRAIAKVRKMAHAALAATETK